LNSFERSCFFIVLQYRGAGGMLSNPLHADKLRGILSHMLDILSKLLGGQARVKLMRLFMMNENEAYDADMANTRAKVSLAQVRRELAFLTNLGFIKRKSFVKVTTNKKGKVKRKRVHGYTFNQDFQYKEEIRAILVGSRLIDHDDVTSRFKKAGSVKLLAVAGVFTNERESRLDALIVMDKPNQAKIEKVIKNFEAEIGKELVYAFFPTAEFLYRLNMYDKLVWDMFDYPHELLVDRAGFSTQLQRKS
jgi:hypothetical protein